MSATTEEIALRLLAALTQAGHTIDEQQKTIQLLTTHLEQQVHSLDRLTAVLESQHNIQFRLTNGSGPGVPDK